ncbi:MAG TPA: winged helix-turn-helix transcriptional regulator [Acholeplasmataceae bacterium]|jgi:ArsR family transcriptional regulator|nr:winged helix-turn-helix transcriptional regulator [Acholeplasmataceae bacterium]
MKETVFSALADPVRIEILNLLKKGRLSAGEIAENFSLSRATTSYHLSILKQADLIRENRYKNFIYYELNLSVFEEMILWLKNFKKERKDEK